MFRQIKILKVFLFLIFGLLYLSLENAIACEICTISRLGRQENLIEANEGKNKWFFEFLYEEQNYNEFASRDAHLLHEDGHDIHNKTTERFYHFTLGKQLNDV